MDISDDFTLMAWIYPFSGSRGHVLGKGYNYALYVREGRLSLKIRRENGQAFDLGVGAIQTNQWMHIAATREKASGNIGVFINGVSVFSYPGFIGEGIYTDDSPFTVGYGRGSSLVSPFDAFNGIIDEVHVLNTSLIPEEISNIYNKTLTPGHHYVTVYARDLAGNGGNATSLFSVGGPDNTPPTYSNLSINNSAAGELSLISVLWKDDSALSGYIFSTNNSGEWVNYSWTPLRGTRAWSNVTLLLNDTIGIDIGWRIYANDSFDNWNDTRIQIITITPPPDTTPPTLTVLSPGNTTYNSTTIDLNVSANEAIDTWWYSLNAGENVIFAPNTTIIATVGSNALIVYANDTAGNIGSKEVYFTVENPKGIKEGVLADLEVLKASASKKQSLKEIDKAIEKIQKSLDVELWVGDNYLDAKHGHRVFQEEKKAIELHLMKITLDMGENADPAIAGDVQLAIEKLVYADELLSAISIEDAKNVVVSDLNKQKKYEEEIEKAEDEMVKAHEQMTKGEYGKAITHYKKAWEHAQAAIEHAGK